MERILEEEYVSTVAVKPRRLYGVGPGHIRALDGLRGIAILFVMLVHFTNAHSHWFSGVPYLVAHFGWCGVDLFFVLSGFLITGILCDAKEDPHYFKKFYMRRVLRIFPLYYGYLFVLFALVPLIHQYSPPVREHIGEQIWLWSYLTNFAYFLSPDLILKCRLDHFWSLAVEEQFYLIWPAVIFLSQPKTAVRITSICIAAALALRVFLIANHVHPVVIFNLTPCRMDALAVGALCALLIRGDLSTSNLLKAARWIAILSGIGMICILAGPGGSNNDPPLMQSIGYSLLALFFGGILLLALDPSKRNVLAWLLSCPILVLFGFYSYAIYVFHFPLVRMFERWFPVRRFSSALHSGGLGLLAHVLCSMLVSLLLAVVSWNIYEKHFLKLKKYFVLRTRSTALSQDRSHINVDRPLAPRLRKTMSELGIWFNQRPFFN